METKPQTPTLAYQNRPITVAESSIYNDCLEVVSPHSFILDTGIVVRFALPNSNYIGVKVHNVSDGATTAAIAVEITDHTSVPARSNTMTTMMDVFISGTQKELKDLNFTSLNKLAVFILNDDGADVTTSITNLKNLIKVEGYQAVYSACDDWLSFSKDKEEPKEICGGIIVRLI